MMESDGNDDPIELPVDGTLDLHTFRARDVKELIPEYLEACRERGIDQVRIVHGKGTGALRRSVRALLGRLRGVREIRTAGPDGGGWGATIVRLDPPGAGKAGAVDRPLRLTTLEDRLAIFRCDADAALPATPQRGSRFHSITRTADELSIVCAEGEVPPGVARSAGWRCLKVEGPLDFAETGVLASLAAPLADAGIAIFVVSTHDTDYLLVKADRLAAAQRRLRAAGHVVDGKPARGGDPVRREGRDRKGGAV